MEFRPYSKAEQLKGHQKNKDKPKPKEKRPKKKKNPYLYRGRIIPTKKERTKITRENYNKMIERYGNYCLCCGYTPIEAHHLTFRSHFGSGNWRNLAPLCKRCHDRAHKDKTFADSLREMRAKELGIHYWKDVYTLFKEGLVPNTDSVTFEKFQREMEKECLMKNGLNGK